MPEGKMAVIAMSAVKVGTILVADDGFTCLGDGEPIEVKQDEHGLFVYCDDGKHYLDGQECYGNENFDCKHGVKEGHYVGFFPNDGWRAPEG